MSLTTISIYPLWILALYYIFHIWFIFQDNENTKIFEILQYSQYQKYQFLLQEFLRILLNPGINNLLELTLTVLSWLYWGFTDLLPYIYEPSQYLIYIYGTILFQQQIFNSYSAILIRFIHNILNIKYKNIPYRYLKSNIILESAILHEWY